MDDGAHRLADEDLAPTPDGLLEVGRVVHDVAEHRVVEPRDHPRADAAADHRAGVEADGDAVRIGRALAGARGHVGERRAGGDACVQGPLEVAHVAEDGHHRVAHELVDHAAARGDWHDDLEVGVEGAQRGVGQLAVGQRGEAADVDEGDRRLDALVGARVRPHVRPADERQQALDDARVHEHPEQVVLFAGAQGAARLARVLHRLVDGDLEILEVDGLDEEVERAAVHGLADVGHVAVGGHDHDLDQRVELAGAAQKREPVHARHVDVGERDLDVRVHPELLERRLAVAGEDELEDALADLLAEALLHEQRHVGLVVDHQDLGGPLGLALGGDGAERGGQLARRAEAPRRVARQGPLEEAIGLGAELGTMARGRRDGVGADLDEQLAEGLGVEGEAARDGAVGDDAERPDRCGSRRPWSRAPAPGSCSGACPRRRPRVTCSSLLASPEASAATPKSSTLTPLRCRGARGRCWRA